jgi:ERCC4-type nuclease
MLLKIDIREKELISLCQKYTTSGVNPHFKDIAIETEALDIGDAILSISGKERWIVERKTIADLASSIKDGRYEEQSHRLNAYPLHNHHIIYIIEGNINDWKYKSIDKQMIYSSIVSLVYYKGFSIIRTTNVEETAYLLCHSVYKIAKGEKAGKISYFQDNTDFMKEDPHESYSTFTKKAKSENITKYNIGELMLCQIPGIHSTTASAIMKQFGSLEQLLLSIRADPSCLQNTSYVTSKGQTRKISKTVLDNIVRFLLVDVVQTEEENIEV